MFTVSLVVLLSIRTRVRVYIFLGQCVTGNTSDVTIGNTCYHK